MRWRPTKPPLGTAGDAWHDDWRDLHPRVSCPEPPDLVTTTSRRCGSRPEHPVLRSTSGHPNRVPQEGQAVSAFEMVHQDAGAGYRLRYRVVASRSSVRHVRIVARLTEPVLREGDPPEWKGPAPYKPPTLLPVAGGGAWHYSPTGLAVNRATPTRDRGNTAHGEGDRRDHPSH